MFTAVLNSRFLIGTDAGFLDDHKAISKYTII